MKLRYNHRYINYRIMYAYYIRHMYECIYMYITGKMEKHINY